MSNPEIISNRKAALYICLFFIPYVLLFGFLYIQAWYYSDKYCVEVVNCKNNPRFPHQQECDYIEWKELK